MVVLLRHAHAIGKQSWRGSDAHRPLSALGQEQAAGLVDTLTGVELRVLYCSPTTRCLDTLAPLAAADGLAIHEHPLLAPDAAADDLFAALDTVDLTGTLWGTALAACTRTDGTRAFPIGDTAKGGAWLLNAHTPPRYIDPDPPQAATRS
ncbi:histidine phosphatase family protein [Rhodococcus sp. JVH1]|uniref:histidine phosphatase family protein n=1 Tax=Rhodococcus sp. JVH1 TaxID=745408 RepID=UPI000272025A|nr:phosphoglycerate mutase family protein [Rhodococcus sp. JVH1]EJJ01535.1 phosphoglycerate mutase family protein [Rhodococcus sp. JVH1]